MMDFIYDGADPSGDMYEILKADKAFNLVRELRFKYNLRVTAMRTMLTIRNGKTHSTFFMANDDGINICKVYVDSDPHDGDTFCYYSPFYEKERGASQNDRHTLRSKKLSSLMSTLKKNEVVTRNGLALNWFQRNIHFAIDEVKTHASKDATKYKYLTPDMERDILDFMFGEKDKESLGDEVLTKLFEAHEKHKVNRKGEIAQLNELNRFFDKFYVAMADEVGGIITGILSMKFNSNDAVPQFHIESPFKRSPFDEVKDRYPELFSCLTMLKVHNEENARRPMVGGIPNMIQYIDELDTVCSSTTSVDEFRCSFMVTPCTSILKNSAQ